jgi:hypothetical protein
MERRAKLKIARWAGPVLGSLLMSGCGAGDSPPPTAQSIPSLSVEMPKVQEFGAARPLGADDYRSPAVAPTPYPVPEWGASPAPAQSTPVESGPVTTMPTAMPTVPWNSPTFAQSVPGAQVADPQSAGASSEPDSVSIDDYLALRAKLQSQSTPDQSPALQAPAAVAPSQESPPSSVATDSIPWSPPRAEDPAIYSPATAPIAPAEQEIMTQRLPEAPVTPVVEAPVQFPASTSPQLNDVHTNAQSTPFRTASASLAVRTPARTPEMNGVSRDAEMRNGRGFDLATRGALMAARREFIEGLRLIALQLDKDGETKHFTQSLASGLAALDEADDFSPRGTRFDVELDLPLLVRGHRTPVLKGTDVKDLSPLVAAGRYYAYAQAQLGMAAGGEMAGSLALYGLGKVHDMINEQRMPKFNAPLPKAMVYHQAALTTDPRNFRAANDLGVLLARAGRMEIAKAMLLHSLSVTSQPAVWRNLAVVHDQLGETQLSARARQLAAASQAEASKAFPPGANPNTSRFAVQWVDPATFATSSRAASDLQQPVPANSPTALSGLPPMPKAPKASSSWSPWGSFPSAASPSATSSKGFFTR